MKPTYRLTRIVSFVGSDEYLGPLLGNDSVAGRGFAGEPGGPLAPPVDLRARAESASDSEDIDDETREFSDACPLRYRSLNDCEAASRARSLKDIVGALQAPSARSSTCSSSMALSLELKRDGAWTITSSCSCLYTCSACFSSSTTCGASSCLPSSVSTGAASLARRSTTMACARRSRSCLVVRLSSVSRRRWRGVCFWIGT